MTDSAAPADYGRDLHRELAVLAAKNERLTEALVAAREQIVELKRQVFAAVEQAAPQAWLATNTSSLSIDSIADGLSRPERLIGLHFFNPVPVSDLVEVVVGRRTDPALVDEARSWVEALGKTGITEPLTSAAPGPARRRAIPPTATAVTTMRMGCIKSTVRGSIGPSHNRGTDRSGTRGPLEVPPMARGNASGSEPMMRWYRSAVAM